MRASILALLLPALVGATTALAQSQIYKTTDQHGNVIFSDQPPADGLESEKVELPPTNTAPAAAVSAPRPAAEEAPPEVVTPTVMITAPANETTIPMGGGDFGVFASVEPALERGQQLLLRIDGAAWGDPQASGAWQLSNVFRGGHDLTVELLDSEGKTIVTSPSVRVYVMRPSVLNQVERR